MKKKMMMAVMALMIAAAPAFAQQKDGKGKRDPKMMSAKMAEKMQFTDAQKAQLNALDAKYTGANYDKVKYREEFHNIMNDDQKKQMQEWKAKREAEKGHKMGQ